MTWEFGETGRGSGCTVDLDCLCVYLRYLSLDVFVCVDLVLRESTCLLSVRPRVGICVLVYVYGEYISQCVYVPVSCLLGSRR